MTLNDETSLSLCFSLSLQFLYSGYYIHINDFNFHIFTYDSQICEYFSGTDLSFFEVPDSYNQLFTKCPYFDISKALQAQHNTKLNSLFPAT